MAISARFRRRVRGRGNRPRATRLRASGVRAEREQCAGDATRRGGPAGGYKGVPTVFLQHTRVSRGGLAREQEDPEVRGGVGVANPSGSIVSSHKSTTSSSSYSSSIAQARPQHLKKAREPPIEPLQSLYTGTSSPWQSQPPSPRITARTTPPAILRPLQLPASFFVTR
jgi:hypothetical protein